jgi:Peptidase inhibitor I9
MRCPSIGSLATLAALLLPFALAAPTHHHKIRNADAKDVIPNSYIIVYKDIVAALAIAAHESSISSMISKWDAQFAGIGAKYNMSSFEGYQVEADSATIAQIAAAPEVC